MSDYSLEAALDLELLDDGFNNAVEAAGAAVHAGLDESTQLEHGIKAYVLTMLLAGWKFCQPGYVNLPTSLVEAEAMQKLGYAYIRAHDPEREI